VVFFEIVALSWGFGKKSEKYNFEYDSSKITVWIHRG